MIRVAVRGLPEVIALGNIDIAQVLDPVIRRGALGIEQRLRIEPAPPSGSRYQRTHKLQQGWNSDFTNGGRGTVGTIINDTPYAHWVQMEGMQARIHRGRWGTDADVIELAIPEIEADRDRAIAEALK